MPGQLSGDEQAAGGLCVGEQQELVVADPGVDMRPDPVEVAP
jgi:hypothetical protein